jgi:hypothetical protein
MAFVFNWFEDLKNRAVVGNAGGMSSGSDFAAVFGAGCAKMTS